MNKQLVIDDVDFKLLNQQREIIAGLLADVVVRKAKQPVVMTQEELDALDGILNMLDDWSDEQHYEREVPEMTRENIQIIAANFAKELLDDLDQLESFVEDVITAQYNDVGGYEFFKEDWLRYGEVDDE